MQTPVTHAYFEERLDRFKVAVTAELRAQIDHQDQAFNQGFVKLREDYARLITDGVAELRGDLNGLVTEKYLEAVISPVRSVAYGVVVMLATLLTGAIAAALVVLRAQ